MEKIRSAVDKYVEIINNAQDYIWANPEVGYKEYKTNDYMIAEFEKLSYKVERFEGITGFTTYFDTGRAGATVLVLAELDGLYCAAHPECDKQTGAVHVCGHHIQCASILGVAAAIRESAINGELSGKVKFAIVPAEEGIELTYRNKLVEDGVISFTSGKPECIKRGMMDGVDVAFMIHAYDLSDINATYWFTKGHNGVIRKKTIIQGKAAHAGAYPWHGINALNAASLAIMATNSLRETFKERDSVRFHSIITKGGDSVNAVPQRVEIESYVRAASVEALKDANFKINRAISGACAAIGTTVEIIDMAGSEPLYEDVNLIEIFNDVGAKLVGQDRCKVTDVWKTSSTDMGDVSCLVPSVHAYVHAFTGIAHGETYRQDNPHKACYDAACLEVGVLMELLKDGGRKAFEIKSKFTPKYPSIENYLETKKAVSKTHKCIEYEGSNIRINLD